MRRAAPALVALVLLSACGSDPAAPEAVGTPAPSPQAERSPVPEPTGPPDIEGLVVTPADELTRDHRDGPLTYEQLPPVGGPHNPRWLACDVYDEPVPDEFAVHSLEHGAVWLTHAPDLAEAAVGQLAGLAEINREYVLVSPYEGLDSRIVAVAWGYSLEASDADDPRLAQFVEAFAGGAQGGEPGVPCRGGGITPREARGQLDA
jgi:hypothetical protein